MADYRYTRIDLKDGKSSSRTIHHEGGNSEAFYFALMQDPRVREDDGVNLTTLANLLIGTLDGTSNATEPHMDGSFLQFDSLNGIVYFLKTL